MPLPTGCVLLRSVVRCSLWVVGKSGERALSRVLLRTVESGAWRVMREIESSLRSREDENFRSPPTLSSRSAPIRDLAPWNRQSPSAASIAPRCQYDCVAPVPLRGLRTKNVDAQRRNEEPLFALSKDGSTILDEGRRTGLQLLMLFSEDGGRITVDVS